MDAPWTLPGKVYLVGAGPGSAELLTVRAVEVLRTTDIVFHDDLVSEEVLAVIPAHTAVHNVGKRCGVKKVTQEEIHRKMIFAARAGQMVVRLKGGDPLIFGRTQEEICALRSADVEFEIVPGVTAASAAAAAAEIPLTDRDKGSRLILASNHRCVGKEIHDWGENTIKDATLVFYMPGQHLSELTQNLAERGLAEDTPCVMVSEAARPQQRIVRTILRDLAKLHALPSPSVLIVGTVASGAIATEWISAKNTSEVIRIFAREESSADLEEPNSIAV